MRLTRHIPLLFAISSSLGYELLREYAGTNFFNGWDWFGSWDNLTLGDVNWLSEADAMAQNLAYINSAGNAIIKVDNTTNVPLNEKRNTVRITTTDFYSVGTLWLISLRHIPFGCSVWPAFWSKGTLWPNDGEIDIIEAINLMDHNQMALHTTAGCTHESIGNNFQKGNNIDTNCGTGSGCTVAETEPDSFAEGFADNGGGVWATQFDVSGIFIWFWPRPSVPSSITQLSSTQTSLDISTWGPPSASYPSGPSCNITNFFTPQQLVLDITLCGDWAGTQSAYTNSACGKQGPTGICYNDAVVGSGANYANAYFEIEWLRTFTNNPSDLPSSSPTTDSGVAIPTGATSESSSQGGSPVVVVTSTVVAGANPSGDPITGNGVKGQIGNGCLGHGRLGGRMLRMLSIVVVYIP
ncbi:Glycosyl Hydrolase Family 16 [Abortiporus biennis]